MSSPASIATHIPRTTPRGPLPQKRALSDSEATDEADTKKIKISNIEQQNSENSKQRDTRDKKKRRKKKRKTSVVVMDVASKPVKSSSATLERPSSNAPSSSMVSGRASSSTLSALESNSQVEPIRYATAGPSSTRSEVERAESETPTLSASDKGKGRASQVIENQTEMSAPAINTDTSDADFQLASKIDLISRHEALLGTLTQSLTCQICLELMYKPYALAPCGHSACYDCLVSWFKAPQGSEPALPHAPAYLRKKTCPHCRAVVRERPTEVWNIKDMVDALVKSKFVEPHPNPPASNHADADPWAGIFRKADMMPNMLPDFLLGHHHHRVREAVPQPAMARQMMGVRDEEDGGIYRCIDCFHEIWDGVCSSCGRMYPGHDASDEDEGLAAHMLWDEPDDTSDLDPEDDDEFRLETWGQHRLAPPWFRLGHFFNHADIIDHVAVGLNEDLDDDDDEDVEEVPPRRFAHIVDQDELEDDDEGGDDDSYEGSFIDDSEIHHIQPRRSHSTSVDAHDEVGRLGAHWRDAVQRVGRHVHSGPSGSSAAHSGDDEDDPRPIAGPSRRRNGIYTRSRGGRVAVISDDEDEVENDEDDLAEQVAAEESLIYGDDGSVPRNRHRHALTDDDIPSDELYGEEHNDFSEDEDRTDDEEDSDPPDYESYDF